MHTMQLFDNGNSCQTPVEMDVPHEQILTPVITTDTMETSNSSPTATIHSAISVSDISNNSSTNNIDINMDPSQVSLNIGVQNQDGDLFFDAEQLLDELFVSTIQTDARSFDGFSNAIPSSPNQDTRTAEEPLYLDVPISNNVSRLDTEDNHNSCLSTITPTTTNNNNNNHVSYSMCQHSDVPHIVKQHEFDLTIPTAEDAILTSKKKFRLEKKSFAVACYTTMTKEHIVKHIEDEFKDLIQYICVSTPDELQTSCSPVYVQIILRKTVNKKTYFLKAVAGMRCNYQVTCDDRAWNAFLKNGHYIEVGQFQSVRSRAGTKWSQAIRQKHQEKRKNVRRGNHRSTATTKTLQATEHTAEEAAVAIMGLVKVVTQKVPIDPRSKYTSTENQHQEKMLSPSLKRLCTLV